jgi:hypothetical protein
MFAKLGPKLGSGKGLTAAEMKEFAISDAEEDDDEDDEDYEYNGGDACLYDSKIDDVDELKSTQDALLEIS